MMFFSVVKWVVECVHRCVPIFVCACFCLLQWLHKLVHSRMEKKSLREMRVLVCQVILVSFFFFLFFFLQWLHKLVHSHMEKKSGEE